MELLLLFLTSILFLSLEFLPYFYSLFITPKGFVSLAVTHYAYDYFYYLSHMAQGASNFLFSTNLHTGEPQVYTYIGWVYVLFGKLFSLFGIFQTTGYQLASFFMMVLFLFVLYRFLLVIFPDSWKKRLGAYSLFLFSNALISVQNGTLTFFDTWSNIGTPFIRLEMVPHHILIQTLLLASLFLVFPHQKLFITPFRKSQFTIHYSVFSIPILSFFLSTLQPLQWALMGASVGIISFLLKPSLTSLLPGILWILAGLPSVLSLRALFQTQPYINTLIWEASQQQNYSIIDFFKFNGITAILGVIGLPLLVKRNSRSIMLLLFYSFLSLILFFSPIPQYFSLLNIRFLSSLPTLLFAISTINLLSLLINFRMGGDLKGTPNDRLRTCDMNSLAIGIEKKVTPRIDQWEKRSTGPIRSSMLDIVYWSLVIVFIALLAPPLYFQMKQRLVYDTNNAYFYLPKGAYDALVYAPKVSSLSDVFLVQWPFSAPFTGLSGRREYHSNFLATIDSQQKDAQSRAFFEKKMNDEEMRAFLKENRITRVITYPWTFPNLPSFFKELHKTDMLVIYLISF